MVTYFTSRLERLFTPSACKTLLMVCIPHSCHNLKINISTIVVSIVFLILYKNSMMCTINYLSLHIQIAGGTFCPEHFLVIGHTIIQVILGKETASGQRFSTCGTLKARFVKVFIVDAQHFTRTFLLAFCTADFVFTFKQKLNKKNC